MDRTRRQNVADTASERPERESQSGDKKQSGNRTKRKRVPSGHRSARQVAMHGAQALCHAAPMLPPQCIGKPIRFARKLVGLNQYRRVRERIRTFDSAVDFILAGQTEETQRQQSNGRTKKRKERQS